MKVRNKLCIRQSKTNTKTKKEPNKVKEDFKSITVYSKRGLNKGDRVTILNPLVIQGYTVPKKYKTGPIDHFTTCFVVVMIKYKKEKKFYQKLVSLEPHNLQFQ